MAEVTRADAKGDVYVERKYRSENASPGDLLKEYAKITLAGAGDYTFTASTQCRVIRNIHYIKFVANETTEDQVPTIDVADGGATATINGATGDTIVLEIVGTSK